MPELRLKDLHFPDFRLPEMSRDDIAKALGEARKELGDVRKELGEMRHDIDFSKVREIELPRVAVPKAVTEAAQAVGLVKRPRSKVPFVAGALVTLGLVGWAVRSSPSLMARFRSVAQSARERIDAMRSNGDDMEPRAFDAAVTIPIQSSAYSEDLPAADSPFDGPTDLPKGLGANGAHGSPDDTESLVNVSRS